MTPADRAALPAALLDRMAAAMAARWRELAAAKVEDSPEGHCADLARVAAAALLDGCEVIAVSPWLRPGFIVIRLPAEPVEESTDGR